MYAKLKNGNIEKYPYTIDDLRKENPNVSFPSNVSKEVLNSYNVVIVVVTGKPEVDYTKNVIEQTPEFDGTKWKQKWAVTNATQEEINQRTQVQSEIVRTERDNLLLECDWTQLIDTPDALKTAYASYRQDLRNIPQQESFPWNVVWPQKPE